MVATSSGVVVVADHFWQALQAPQRTEDRLGSRRQCAGSTMPIRDKPLSRRSRRWRRVRWRAKTATPAAALNSAKTRLVPSYELPMLAHATMEPMNCTADVRDGPLRPVRRHAGPADGAGGRRRRRGPEAGRGQRQTTLLGGGFGRRLEVDFIPAAVAASKARGCAGEADLDPRRRDARAGTYRPPARDESAAASTRPAG